ncbi:MAG: cytochrome B [Bacteroidia bacterium]|nr:cytochrome B [Bacteroidia bacterium]
MDNILINAHSILRWAVLLFGLYAITKSARGLIKNQEYTKNHKMAATLFVASMHLQVLLGLLLYVSRGWMNQFSDMANAMGNSTIRFWTVEHIFGMILAAVLIQIGSTKSKKATDVRKKHKTALTFFTIGMIIILATIPWPFRGEVARSLWP